MFGMNMFPGMPRAFDMTYRCYSVSMFPSSDKQSLEDGGKIIMPPSALETLTHLNVEYPMMFRLSSRAHDRHTHCGVLEFVADEGRIYIPYWMMRNLLLDEGDAVSVQVVTLPVATYSKFEPQSEDFLDISNPKAVLENSLRKFSCLTANDMIAINYNEHIYELRVLEVKPSPAVNIIECDMNVEFAPPPGYQEPQWRRPDAEGDGGSVAAEAEDARVRAVAERERFLAFRGTGARLDGKQKDLALPLKELVKNLHMQRGVPDYDYKPGSVRLWRGVERPATPQEGGPAFEAFRGDGNKLRHRRNK